jgi:predicted nucleotidyltransferase
MADHAARGLDRHGFILPEVSLARVRPPYAPVIAALSEQCRVVFLSDLHSLYLTGSVVKGTARPGQSDLDALAVLQVAPTLAHEESAQRIADAVAERFPFVTEASLLLACREAILSEEQRNDMGFFVKSLCICVAGEDLGEHLPRYRPSVALACGTNGNIRLLLDDRRRRLVSTSDPADVAAICRGIMRKIVRTGFTLIMPRYQGWTSDLERSASIFASYYPCQSAAMQEALILAQVPSTEKTPVLAVIDTFGAWLADEYDRVIWGRAK